MKKSYLFLPLIVVSLAGCQPTTTDTTSGLGALLSIELASGLKESYVQYEIVEQNMITILADYENGSETIN